MAAKYRDIRNLPGSLGFFVDKLRNIGMSGLAYTVTGEREAPNGKVVLLSRSMTFWSWGDNIVITLTANGEQTTVNIYSECSLSTQIIDWGQNKRNVNELFGYLMTGNAQQPAAQS